MEKSPIISKSSTSDSTIDYSCMKKVNEFIVFIDDMEK